MDLKENNKPIYLQIADKICDDVMSGTYPPGSRIPSVREYAAMVQVNANTVMRSFEHLSGKDIIVNKRGIGYFITPDAQSEITKLRNETFFKTEMIQFFERLVALGINTEQLSELYTLFLKQQKK